MGIWYSGVYILLAMYCNILQFPSQLMVINSGKCFYRGTNINYKLYYTTILYYTILHLIHFVTVTSV